MNDEKLNQEIFDSITTLKEYFRVCRSFNYLIISGYLKSSAHLLEVSQMTFRKLTRIKDGN